MSGPFSRLRYHAYEGQDAERAPDVPLLRGVGPAQTIQDEAVARMYLSELMRRDDRPAMRSVLAEERPESVPNLRLAHTREVGGSRTTKQDRPYPRNKLLHFEQTHCDVTIFGSNVLVELDRQRRLVSVDARLAEIDPTRASTLRPYASLSDDEALARIASSVGKDVSNVHLPGKVDKIFYFDERRADWRLVLLFRNVSFTRSESEIARELETTDGHGLGPSPRSLFPEFDFLIDAHDGSVLERYRAQPTLCKLYGRDEMDVGHSFFGENSSESYEMIDERRRIKICDLQGGQVKKSVPVEPLSGPKADWDDANRAAVSAHVNVRRVYDFYNSVLQRRGIDDQGSDVVAFVNCRLGPGEVWKNAVWWDRRMWFGQNFDTEGRLRSYAQHLDIIAHELMHGVTESTARLKYKDQSGALDESFSDIFGVIINNWYDTEKNVEFDEGGCRNNTANWNWRIGTGLGQAGKPLRDLSNPRATGDPDHMNDFVVTDQDEGGVHTNSNIHNKAAYNVLSSVRGDSQPAISPREAALLYYLALERLYPNAGFELALQALIDVATTYYAGDVHERDAKLRVIRDAYAAVGITTSNETAGAGQPNQDQ